jgi:uncharacterized protein YkwD
MKLLASLALVLMLGAPAQADMASDALSLINQQRTAKGCPALQRDASLQTAAERHARDMANANYFSHTGKNGSKHGQRYRKAGYGGQRTAENIAGGQKSASEVVTNWMNSQGHRKNILNCKYRDTGLAVVYQADDKPLPGNSYPLKYYWVQTFGAN